MSVNLRYVLTLALDALRLEPPSVPTPWHRSQAITRARAREELAVALTRPDPTEHVAYLADRIRRDVSLCAHEGGLEATCVECNDRWRLIDLVGGARPWMPVVIEGKGPAACLGCGKPVGAPLSSSAPGYCSTCAPPRGGLVAVEGDLAGQGQNS